MDEFSYFFDLPGELREQILQYLCVIPGGIHIGNGPSLKEDPCADEDLSPWYSSPEAVLWPLNLFLVNLQFYQEASGIYFGQNTFHLHAASRRHAKPLISPETGVLAAPAYQPSRRRMRHVVLYLARIRGQLRDEVYPPLFDMILSGSLRLLDVRFQNPPPPNKIVIVEHARDREAARLRNPPLTYTKPFQTLLQLLADPDLERTTLSVAAEGHWTFWCPFHAPVDSEISPPGRPPTVVQVADDGPAWIRLDVPRLLEAYGGPSEQLRILKIGD